MSDVWPELSAGGEGIGSGRGYACDSMLVLFDDILSAWSWIMFQVKRVESGTELIYSRTRISLLTKTFFPADLTASRILLPYCTHLFPTHLQYPTVIKMKHLVDPILTIYCADPHGRNLPAHSAIRSPVMVIRHRSFIATPDFSPLISQIMSI